MTLGAVGVLLAGHRKVLHHAERATRQGFGLDWSMRQTEGVDLRNARSDDQEVSLLREKRSLRSFHRLSDVGFCGRAKAIDNRRYPSVLLAELLGWPGIESPPTSAREFAKGVE